MTGAERTGTPRDVRVRHGRGERVGSPAALRGRGCRAGVGGTAATETLRKARELIDAGRPFAAHEVLEARWKAGPAEEADLWQGLAQVCVALTPYPGNQVGAQLGSSNGPGTGCPHSRRQDAMPMAST